MPAILEKNAPLEAPTPYEMRLDMSRNVPEPDIRSALASGDIGFLHSFTTGSAVDGPGLRLVAWTTACMFRCQFCHNPDTWTLNNGMPVPLAKAVNEVGRYANGLKVMHGGLTISGGEPLMQHRFVSRLCAAAKMMEVHTAIETNGFYGSKLTDEDLGNIDLVILDMKAFTPDQHKKVTGIDANIKVKEFARRLGDLHHPMWLRYVLVPGLTDIDAEMEALAGFASSLGVVEKVEVLPFHQLGRFKWERLKLDYTLAQTQPPTPEQVDHAAGIFRAAGLEAD